jgi:hypothetical protein
VFFIYSFFTSSQVIAQLKDWNEVDGCLVDGVPTLKCLEVVFSNLLFLSSAFFLLALFIMLVSGGFTYLTSFGNPEKVKKAQGTIKFAIIGFVIFLASYLILTLIDFLFLGGQGKIFQFKIGE